MFSDITDVIQQPMKIADENNRCYAIKDIICYPSSLKFIQALPERLFREKTFSFFRAWNWTSMDHFSGKEGGEIFWAHYRNRLPLHR